MSSGTEVDTADADFIGVLHEKDDVVPEKFLDMLSVARNEDKLLNKNMTTSICDDLTDICAAVLASPSRIQLSALAKTRTPQPRSIAEQEGPFPETKTFGKRER